MWEIYNRYAWLHSANISQPNCFQEVEWQSSSFGMSAELKKMEKKIHGCPKTKLAELVTKT